MTAPARDTHQSIDTPAALVGMFWFTLGVHLTVWLVVWFTGPLCCPLSIGFVQAACALPWVAALMQQKRHNAAAGMIVATLVFVLLNLATCALVPSHMQMGMPESVQRVRVAFPVRIPGGSWGIHPHLLFESLAYLSGFLWFRWLRKHRGDPLATRERLRVVVAAVAGAVVGSKVLALANDPFFTWQHKGDVALWISGKTIVGALLGGWLAVEWIKRRSGIRAPTGDLFALPLCVGIIVGRIGCHLSGLEDHTYGVATSQPTGIDFGDGVLRHPTALYEIAFLLVTGLVLARVQRWAKRGVTFASFVSAYCAFRFVVDFWKPDHALLGLSGIQWAAGCGMIAAGVRVVRLARAPVIA